MESPNAFGLKAAFLQPKYTKAPHKDTATTSANGTLSETLSSHWSWPLPFATR